MRNYSPSHDELHIDPSEFAENRLYMIEGGEYDFDLAERELAEEVLGTVPEESGETNPTRLTREDRELFYDPPLRPDAEIASANRRAWYTRRGRVCLYPDCGAKVRYTKTISYCEAHQDSEVARYTDPGHFHETNRINPRVYGLKKARTDRTSSRIALAELAGIDPRRIQRFEVTLDNAGPTPEERKALADVLEGPESELLRDPDLGVM
jgi:hypothetical protein